MQPNFKIVYVLISTPDDLFYEQILISILSLKKVMPKSYVVLLTDKETEATLSGEYRGKIRDYVQEIKIVEFSPDVNNVLRSRLLKTFMRNHVEGDFLYLDCDTVIVDSFDDNAFNCEMGRLSENYD